MWAGTPRSPQQPITNDILARGLPNPLHHDLRPLPRAGTPPPPPATRTVPRRQSLTPGPSREPSLPPQARSRPVLRPGAPSRAPHSPGLVAPIPHTPGVRGPREGSTRSCSPTPARTRSSGACPSRAQLSPGSKAGRELWPQGLPACYRGTPSRRQAGALTMTDFLGLGLGDSRAWLRAGLRT